MLHNLFKIIPYITIDINKKIINLTTNIVTYCVCTVLFEKNIAHKFIIH